MATLYTFRRHAQVLARMMLCAIALLGSLTQPVTAQGTVSANSPIVLIMGIGAGSVPPDIAELLTEDFVVELAQQVRSRGDNVDVRNPSQLAAILALQQQRTTLGGEPGDIEEALMALDSDFVWVFLFTRVGDTMLVTSALRNDKTGMSIRSAQQAMSVANEDYDALFNWLALDAQQAARTLASDLRAARVRPAVPRVAVEVDRQELPAGQPVTVTAQVVDLDTGTPAAQVPVTLERIAPSGAKSQLGIGETDAAGIVRHTFTTETIAAIGGTVERIGRITAQAERIDGMRTTSNTAGYRVLDPNASMTAKAAKVNLPLRGNDTVCATLRANGTPLVGKPIGFGATDGTLNANAAFTAANGEACVPYVGPARNALVDVVAVTAPTPTQAAQQAIVSLVVDAGVVFNASGPVSITIGGAATLSFDLTQNGLPLAGVPVNFTLDGPGLLSGNVAQTDAAGRADLVYLALPSVGAATVTARVVVDGQSYERVVTVGTTQPPDSGAMTAELGVPTTYALLYGRDDAGQDGGELTCVYGRLAPPPPFPPTCPFDGPPPKPPFALTARRGALTASMRLEKTANQVEWSYAQNNEYEGSALLTVVALKFAQSGFLAVDASVPDSPCAWVSVNRIASLPVTGWPITRIWDGSEGSDDRGTVVAVAAGESLFYAVLGIGEDGRSRQCANGFAGGFRFAFRKTP